jgi:hypothetical protein
MSALSRPLLPDPETPRVARGGAGAAPWRGVVLKRAPISAVQGRGWQIFTSSVIQCRGLGVYTVVQLQRRHISPRAPFNTQSHDGGNMRNHLVRLAAYVTVPISAAALTFGALPVSAAHALTSLRCSAWMSNPHPADYTTTKVRVHTVKFAKVKTVAHYRTTNTTHHGKTNSHGRATIPYYISGATPGYRVKVDITVRKNSRVGHCQTAFTPHR